MINREQLDAAHQAGLLQAGQVAPLLAFLSADDEAKRIPDPEEVHFARGFHDIFITIGLNLFFVGLIASVLYLTGDNFGFSVFLLVMAASWLMAEWFSKKLRLALPSLMLAITFMISGGLTISFFINVAEVLLYGQDTLKATDVFGSDWPEKANWLQGLTFAGLIGLGGLFHWRFKVPITPSLMMLAVAGLLMFILGKLDPTMLKDHHNVWIFIIGLMMISVAMMFDARDPLRQTVNSDRAFWLHLIAAPMLVHAVLSGFIDMENNSRAAIAILLLVAVLGLVSLIIDRRAILASALGYIGIAISTILKDINFDTSGVLALTLLMLGVFVLMMGSGWSSLRKLVMRPLSGTAVACYVPPVSQTRVFKVKESAL